MSWKPDVYLRYERYRTRPARDLVNAIPLAAPGVVADLGCGPGNSTAVLAERFPRAHLIGVDSSPAMLKKASATNIKADWVEADVAVWEPDQPCDLIFSNATFQWVSEPASIIRRLMGCLLPGGVFALQVPANMDQPSHTLIRETLEREGHNADVVLSAGPRFTLSAEEYFSCLKGLSIDLDIWDTEYLQILEGDDPVMNWTASTALRPVEHALGAEEYDKFKTVYGAALKVAYPKRPDGSTLFPFKRRFAVGVRK